MPFAGRVFQQNRPGAVIRERLLCGNQHGQLTETRRPGCWPGISTVVSGLSGWQSCVDGRRFPHQFNGTEFRHAGRILFAAQGLAVNLADLVKQQSSELCSTTCWIN
jgi:hypothetical protein